ncbi:hypothetical protein G4B88_019203 [Cannabis sativa]|uniref:Uncharacterized protein n=1 Tax=Cannabis sativa TaxID=3483 RepID=A0A7J6HMF1_CANSA|nr:hypothetical protein G4B88_019203 [Cannabis sativa]
MEILPFGRVECKIGDLESPPYTKFICFFAIIDVHCVNVGIVCGTSTDLVKWVSLDVVSELKSKFKGHFDLALLLFKF